MLEKTFERYQREFIGKRFGRLRVLDILRELDKFNNVYCLCACDCRTNITPHKVRLNHLRYGITKSCGCVQKEIAKIKGKEKMIDMTGQKFGYLTVLKIDTSKKSSNTYWKCQCDCGKIYSTTGSRLRLKTEQSCGCQVMKKRLKTIHKNGSEKAIIKIILRQYRASAKRRKLSFSLTYQDFAKLITSNCIYCNSEPQNYRTIKYQNQELYYNGVDRLNPDLGYEINNCAPCCIICNRAKSDLSLEKWKAYINKIVIYNLERTKNAIT